MTREPSEASAQGTEPGAEEGGRTLVVGVGASAGGLDAYKQLLSRIPSDSGIAFIFLLHLDPHQKSMMAEILSKHPKLPVTSVEEGDVVRPNHVYVIPPNKFGSSGISVGSY